MNFNFEYLYIYFKFNLGVYSTFKDDKMAEQKQLTDNQRRNVLKALGIAPLASAGLFINFAMSSCSNSTTPSDNSIELKLANEPSLANIDGFLRRTYGSNNNGDPIIIIKTEENTYRCFSVSCPKNCEKKSPAPALGDPKNKGVICETCPMKAKYSLEENNFGNVLESGPSQTLREFPVTFNATTGIIKINF
jgi:hypothetical protein